MKGFKINTQKITIRLTLKYTLFIFITLVILSATTLGSVRFFMDDQSYDYVENISESIEDKLEINQSFSASDLNDISIMNDNITLNIIKNGTIIFESDDDEEYNLPITPMDGPKSKSYEDDRLIYFNKEYVSENNEVFIVQVIKDMEDEKEFIGLLFRILLVLNTIAFFVSIVLGFIMSKRALKPIDNIVKQAKDISGSDLSKRINIEGPNDELKRLAETFNEMIASIEKRYEIQNRFALDASHEIATPLSVINGYVDIIRRWGKDDPEVFNEAIGSIKKEIKNMSELLDKLSFVARTDNDISTIEKSKFSLNELIQEVVKESTLIHTTYNVKLHTNEGVVINADRRLIKQMLRAIIDNSVKYSEEGSLIGIDTKQVNNQVKIEISDEGIGIASEDLTSVFDRFFRVDKVRTRNVGGSGLGLSIVKWIVEAHKGTIHIESVVEEGTNIVITLPINIS
jgi:two-component system sensor histidine kinase ArlS